MTGVALHKAGRKDVLAMIAAYQAALAPWSGEVPDAAGRYPPMRTLDLYRTEPGR
jgi:hypothetical protein